MINETFKTIIIMILIGKIKKIRKIGESGTPSGKNQHLELSLRELKKILIMKS